jgi:hypothetical protein
MANTVALVAIAFPRWFATGVVAKSNIKIVDKATE